jgi:ankyrin repeat protein
MELPGWLIIGAPVGAMFGVLLLIWWFVRKGTTAIHRAASGGDAAALARLLADRPDRIDAKDSMGLRPLQYAASWGQIETGKVLLEHGVDPNGGDGWTPLQYAVGKGYREMVELLLDGGADVNAKCPWDDSTALHTAVIHKQVPIVRLLIDRGASVDAETKSGWNACHFAAGEGDIESLQILVDHGTDWRAVNAGGQTPAQVAKANGRKEIVALLKYLQQGVK